MLCHVRCATMREGGCVKQLPRSSTPTEVNGTPLSLRKTASRCRTRCAIERARCHATHASEMRCHRSNRSSRCHNGDSRDPASHSTHGQPGLPTSTRPCARDPRSQPGPAGVDARDHDGPANGFQPQILESARWKLPELGHSDASDADVPQAAFSPAGTKAYATSPGSVPGACRKSTFMRSPIRRLVTSTSATCAKMRTPSSMSMYAAT